MKKLFYSLAIALGICASVEAQTITTSSADYARLNLGGATNIAAASATNLNIAIQINLQKDTALGFGWQATQAGITNVSAYLIPSLDGTTNTMDTQKAFLLTGATTSGGASVATTNFQSTMFGGYNWLILNAITNGFASSTITNVYFIVPSKRNAR